MLQAFKEQPQSWIRGERQILRMRNAQLHFSAQT